MQLFGIAVAICTSPAEASPSPSSNLAPSPAGNITIKTMKAAEQSLIDSGPALAYTGAVLSAIALSAGVDIEPFLKHGQFIAISTNLKGLDVNFTKCASGTTGNAAKATCPTNQNEKFFTRWASNFNMYGLSFLVIPATTDTPPGYPTVAIDETGFADPFHPDVRISRAASCLVFFLVLNIVVIGIQIIAYKMTATEEHDYDKALEDAINHPDVRKSVDVGNFGPKRCGIFKNSWPQHLYPCVPVRYWLNIPYLQIKMLMSFHFSICSMGFLAITAKGGEAIGAILLLIALAMPAMSFIIIKKLLKDGDESGSLVMQVNNAKTYVFKKAWRDRDIKEGKKSSNYPKTWRKSAYTNRFGAVFYHLKEKRVHYGTIRLSQNFLEAAILVGLFNPGRPYFDGFAVTRPDYASIAAAVYYILDFFFLILYRPHRRCIKTVMAILQSFLGFTVVMASVLYVTEGIFNTQDLLKIETDGVEQMLCIFCSVGCSVWFLALTGDTVLTCLRVKSNLAAGVSWDVETDNYRRNNMTRGASAKSGISALTERSNDAALPAMLLHMRKATMDTSTNQEDPGLVLKKADQMVELTPNTTPNSNLIAQATSAVASTQNVTVAPAAALAHDVLPPGWTSAVAPSGHTYYHHERHGTQWTFPTAEVASPVAVNIDPLPSNWAEVKTADGRAYFHHRVTNETSWVRPAQ
jgi:hypothetical protein